MQCILTVRDYGKIACRQKGVKEMEDRLRALFDYQHFENNPRLSVMLTDAYGRNGFSGEGELADEDVDLLNAAGSISVQTKTDAEKPL